ncbi:MAG: sigma-70 family RNA polymerase sigma factor [Actinomycetota bacterium]|nr:sigma-70 family RNA polymerase sigma factor [Actinomycetota bacterium]
MASLLKLEASTDAHARLSLDAVRRLVECAATGDERAWQGLVDEFGGLVWAVTRAHRLGGADAADVAQTTWLRLVEHLDRLDEPARVGAWLATTARRECLAVLRRSARLVPRGDELPEPADEGPAHDATLLAHERDATLWTVFAGLSERDRALLRMLIADPAPSYEEIGAALEMPIGSIGPTRARALERLRRAVERLDLTPSLA